MCQNLFYKLVTSSLPLPFGSFPNLTTGDIKISYFFIRLISWLHPEKWDCLLLVVILLGTAFIRPFSSIFFQEIAFSPLLSFGSEGLFITRPSLAVACTVGWPLSVLGQRSFIFPLISYSLLTLRFRIAEEERGEVPVWRFSLNTTCFVFVCSAEHKRPGSHSDPRCHHLLMLLRRERVYHDRLIGDITVRIT